ncbi:hypothetical protein [Rhodococcus opacus]|uniref:hypothetical protein n=1 Tax=Rhodococcus opacus TaxID=37919 RepID=UPI00155AFD42|nr:hypothetical protein [Rhodococcus opacus]
MAGSTIAERLGVFAAGLEVDALPLPVIERATGCLLHALAVEWPARPPASGDRPSRLALV